MRFGNLFLTVDSLWGNKIFKNAGIEHILKETAQADIGSKLGSTTSTNKLTPMDSSDSMNSAYNIIRITLSLKIIWILMGWKSNWSIMIKDRENLPEIV